MKSSCIPTPITRNIQLMTELGLVRTVPSKEDGRVRVIRLTAKGRRTLSAALESWREVRKVLAEQVGRERTDQLLALLRETLERLEGDAPDARAAP